MTYDKIDRFLMVLIVFFSSWLLCSGSPYRPEIKAFSGWGPVLPGVTGRIIMEASRDAGVPYDVGLFLALAESSGDPIVTKRVPGGRGVDQGIFQLNTRWHGDFVWRFNGGKPFSPLDVRDSAWIAMRYLAALYREFGSWRKALEAYNAGADCVRSGEIPKSTRNYANWILNGGF
ncbi:MAG: transglycosylase SLT domain-containing protein [Spirochaetales bacterium]|nr:transglycosylase SLT domain-containing protein [Spirochaetales bacterium]